MIVVTFTDQELEATTQLIDIAVRAQGIAIAEPAAVLLNKFRNAVAAARNTNAGEQAADEAPAG